MPTFRSLCQLALFALSTSLIAACGIKGPLVMPGTVVTHAPSTAPAARPQVPAADSSKPEPTPRTPQ